LSEHSTSPSLLDRVARRDEGAWERLVSLYTPLVHFWCRRGGLAGEDVHDVTQDVFQAVAANLEQFRAEHRGGSFRGWLRGIARHKLVDQHQRRDRQPRAEGGTDAYRRIQEEPGPLPEEDDTERTEVSALYRRVVDLVRDEFEQRTWQAFWRTGVEDQPAADVARELGMTEVAVRKAKSRVLRRLKEEAGELLG
jgi:RNA polymerase sigma-70 factor (ECF subfamily)